MDHCAPISKPFGYEFSVGRINRQSDCVSRRQGPPGLNAPTQVMFMLQDQPFPTQPYHKIIRHHPCGRRELTEKGMSFGGSRGGSQTKTMGVGTKFSVWMKRLFPVGMIKFGRKLCCRSIESRQPFLFMEKPVAVWNTCQRAGPIY